MSSDDDERKSIRADFHEAVNMTPKQLGDWLKTDESKSVGQGADEGESTGHESGRMIVAIKHRKQADLTEEDYGQMKRVVSYVHRHLAQRPKGDVSETRWRYSLMNWGHDPKH